MRDDETFYPGPSRIHLAAFPPKERWDNWTELDSRAWPKRKERHYSLVPTTCFNCESACGLLAYIDKVTGEIQKFEGNPEHPGSRGRNCAKGPATLNQVTDPDRILYPLKRAGKRGEGKWERTTWDEALDTIAARIEKQSSKNVATRSCTTSAVPAKMASPNAYSLRGVLMVTTRTQTFARQAVAKVTNSGWDSIDRAPITKTLKSFY